MRAPHYWRWRRLVARYSSAEEQQTCACAGVAAALLLMVLTVVTHQRTYFYQTAEGFYRSILAENAMVWCVPQNLGAILHLQGKYDEALPLYTQAIAMNPADTMLYDGAGTILLDWGHRDGMQPGRLAQAIDYFREACRLEPRNFVAQRNLGTALSDVRQYEEARRQFQTALEIYPQDAPAYVGLATLDSATEDWAHAATNYQQALAINPDYGAARLGLAMTLVRAGQLQEALPQMQRAVELEPNDARAQFEMGNLLAQESIRVRRGPLRRGSSPAPGTCRGMVQFGRAVEKSRSRQSNRLFSGRLASQTRLSARKPPWTKHYRPGERHRDDLGPVRQPQHLILTYEICSAGN